MNIFITRINIFICLDNPVYLDLRELYLSHGEECDFVAVERTPQGGYVFDFGNLFSEKAFNFFPAYYDILLGKSESFIKINSDTFDIHDIHSSDYHYSQDEMSEDLKLLEQLTGLRSMELSDLKRELQRAVKDEDYPHAAKVRDEINRRSSV